MTFNLNFTNLKNKVSAQQTEIDQLNSDFGTLDSNFTAHLTSTLGAHLAEAIEVTSITGLSSGDVQSALSEILGKLNDHLTSSDAHEASKIGADPLSTIDQTDVQALLEGLEQLELTNFNTVQTRIDNLTGSQIGVTTPVNRSFSNIQTAIDTFNLDIVGLKDTTTNHQDLIDQLLNAQLNASNSTATVQTSIDNLRTGITGFSGFIFPLGPAPTPQTGSGYFDPTGNKLYIYNGSGYKSVQLS